MSKTKKILLSVLIGLFIVSGTMSYVKISSAEISTPGLFKKIGNAIIPFVSTWTFGDSSNRISKIWASDLDTSLITIGGAITGDLTLGASNVIKWSTDTGLARGAAGVLKVTDGSTGYGKIDIGGLLLDRTITAGGTTGNQTINKPSGTVNIAAAGTTVTVTNSLVTTSSIIYAVIRTNDATATIKNVVPAAGSFVINLGAAATAEISIGFLVSN